jgi:3',5'-cyclic AMP phosphodiesterase CpdA
MTIESKLVRALSRLSRSARLFAGALTVVALMIGGCHPSDSPSGQVQVSVLALSSADVAKVKLTVTGPAFSQPMVFSLFKQSNQWGGLLGGLPAGGGAMFTASASDSTDTEIFHGQATNVAIVAGQVVTVVITAQQTSAPPPFSNATPVIDSLVVSATDVVPGAVVQLQAAAHDPNAGDTLTYLWTAAAGTLSATSTPSVTWTAPASEGSCELDIKVADNHGASATTSVTIHVANANGKGQAAVTVQLNQWPTVNQVTATPAWVVLGQSTALVASAVDGDSDPLTYAWTSSCAGTFSNTTAAPSFMPSGQPSASACAFTVTVSDGRGGSTTGDLTVPVGVPTLNQAPVVFATVQSNTSAHPGQTITLQASASDPEGGALTFTWSPPAGVVGTQVDVANGSTFTFTAPSGSSPTWTVTFTATDVLGASSHQDFSIANLGPVNFAIISDPHLHDDVTLGASGPDFQAYLAQDRKMIAQSQETLDATLADLTAKKPEFLLISGDLTKDGEKVNHQLMASKLATLRAQGIPTFVIPGNHDINNPGAVSYLTSPPAPVDHVSPAEFKQIYANFGYNAALYQDPNSLSYVVEPVAGLWLFAIDSCEYADNLALNTSVTAGMLSDATQSWITGLVQTAKLQGKVVIGMMHHGIIEHYVGQSQQFPEYVLTNYATVGKRLSDAGMNLIFTGHFHANDIVLKDFGTSKLYDCETGSLVTAPTPYRFVNLDMPARSCQIATSHVLSIPSHPTDFVSFENSFLQNGLIGISTYQLTHAPYNLDAATAAAIAPMVAVSMMAHYAGDEKLTDATLAATLYGMAGSSDPATQMLGMGLLSLWNDPPPADNNVTLTVN